MTQKTIIGTVELMNTGRADLFNHSTPGNIEYHVFNRDNKLVTVGNGTPKMAGAAVETALNKMI